jgi:hypothetical protein
MWPPISTAWVCDTEELKRGRRVESLIYLVRLQPLQAEQGHELWHALAIMQQRCLSVEKPHVIIRRRREVKTMVVRWFLFETRLGDLLLVFLERKAGLAVVQADWLAVQPAGQPKVVSEVQ